MRVSVVLFYNPAQRYGFIKAEPCNIFFVAGAVQGPPVRAGGVAVEYEAVPAGAGSPRATLVRVIDPSVIGESERVLVPPDRDP